jgi:hypothetical protein
VVEEALHRFIEEGDFAASASRFGGVSFTQHRFGMGVKRGFGVGFAVVGGREGSGG